MTLPGPIVSAKSVLTRYLNQLVPLLDEASETFGKPFEFPEDDADHNVYVKTMSARLITLDSDINALLAKLISKNAVMYTYLNTSEYSEFYTDIRDYLSSHNVEATIQRAQMTVIPLLQNRRGELDSLQYSIESHSGRNSARNSTSGSRKGSAPSVTTASVITPPTTTVTTSHNTVHTSFSNPCATVASTYHHSPISSSAQYVPPSVPYSTYGNSTWMPSGLHHSSFMHHGPHSFYTNPIPFSPPYAPLPFSPPISSMPYSTYPSTSHPYFSGANMPHPSYYQVPYCSASQMPVHSLAPPVSHGQTILDPSNNPYNRNTYHEPSASFPPVSGTPVSSGVVPPLTIPISSSSTSLASHAKFPEITLPSFDGNHLAWDDFIDAYDISVHKRDLPDQEKMILLKQSLTGRARQAIDKFRSSQYQKAYDHLKSRFGKSDIVLLNLVNELSDLPQCKDNILSLRDTVDKMQSIIALLDDYDQSSNATVVKMLSEKFTPRLQKRIAIAQIRDTAKDKWTVSRLMEFAEQYLSEEEDLKARLKEGNISHSHSPSDFDLSVNAVTFSRHSKHSSSKPSSESSSSFDLHCVFCNSYNSNHRSFYCKKYRSLEDRKVRLDKLNRCYNCGKSDHFANACKYTSCPRCPKSSTSFHGRFLCPLLLGDNHSESRGRPSRRESHSRGRRSQFSSRHSSYHSSESRRSDKPSLKSRGELDDSSKRSDKRRNSDHKSSRNSSTNSRKSERDQSHNRDHSKSDNSFRKSRNYGKSK